MQLDYHYWYFTSALPAATCDKIINLGKTKQGERNFIIEQALTGSLTYDQKLSKEQIEKVKKKRDSNIFWLEEEWIYHSIHPFIHAANKNAGWNFDWDCSEPCQFTIYKKGQHYDWHSDSLEKPSEKEGLQKGKIRKLSVTVSLSDPENYKGGELEFDFKNNEPGKKSNTAVCEEILPKGSIVVFPSFVWHRVRKVTDGERNSLVMWNLGYPFK